MDHSKVKSEGNTNVTAPSKKVIGGKPPDEKKKAEGDKPPAEKKHPGLLTRRDFDFLGDSCQLKYPFDLVGFEKIFFKCNKIASTKLTIALVGDEPLNTLLTCESISLRAQDFAGTGIRTSTVNFLLLFYYWHRFAVY